MSKIGERHGKLVVLAPTNRRDTTSTYYVCLCDCGNIVALSKSALRGVYERKACVNCDPRMGGRNGTLNWSAMAPTAAEWALGMGVREQLMMNPGKPIDEIVTDEVMEEFRRYRKYEEPI